MILILSAVLILGIGGWAAMTRMSGAVVGHGVLVSESYSKKVQHPTGGVVSALFVNEGQRVKAGDLLIRLEDTQVRAGLAITENDLMLLEAREQRLKAEEAASTGGAGAGLLSTAGQSSDMARQLNSERKLLEARRLMRARQKEQLEAQIAGQSEQIQGLHAMAASRDRQMALVNDELNGVKTLYGEGYAPISSLKALQRQAESLEGEKGQLEENAAEANNKIAGLRMQSLAIDAQHLSEVMTDLRDGEIRRGELVQKDIAQKDELARLDIRSPQDGFVHQLTVHTVGGVIGQGEPLMMIVPANDTLAVEVRVDPKDISELSIGQKATVKFVGLNQRTKLDIVGAVSRISSDLNQDPKTGASYYLLRIEIPTSQISRLGAVKLVPGMPVETFIQTSDRSVLSYILSPLEEQLGLMFRER